jgi:hypothetical protein
MFCLAHGAGDGTIPQRFPACSKASQDGFAYIDGSGAFRTANKVRLMIAWREFSNSPRALPGPLLPK